MLGDRIRERRVLMKMTQAELAKKLGLGHTTISCWEKGSSKPYVDTIDRLAEVLGTTPGYLLEYTDDPAIPPPEVEPEDEERQPVAVMVLSLLPRLERADLVRVIQVAAQLLN